MYKKNQGHGICGAKNIYSTNVKLGNWVEDTIGADLVQTERPVFKSYASNTSLSYMDPRDQPPLPSMPINMPSTQELKAKNKEGMQYSLIFDHGLKEITPEVCMCTRTQFLFRDLTSFDVFLFTGEISYNKYADHHEETEREG